VTAGDDVYELRLRKDRDGFDLVGDCLRHGPIWYAAPTRSATVSHSRGTARASARTGLQSACWTPAAL
jgi:hypothetical protein